ncbi:MAG: hypothetical protein PHE93_05555 [Clostridia bacterium]|nr:hypothetical protein [Clostridia bacterium]
MAKKLDTFVLTFLTFTLLFLWSRFFIDDLIWSLVFSAIVCFLIVLCIRAFSIKIKKRPYSIERLSREFSLKGNNYTAQLIADALKNPSIEVENNMLKFGSTCIICNFKFSNLSSADVASAYQLAISKSLKSVVLLCRGVDRQALSLTVGLPVKIEILKTGAVYRFLFRMNALPQLDKEKYKFSFKYIFDVALKRQNAKFFIFSGLLLLSLSYFTPLKLYYLCFGSSLLLLAILCLSPLGHIGEESKHKLFDTFSVKEDLDNNDSTFSVRKDKHSRDYDDDDYYDDRLN